MIEPTVLQRKLAGARRWWRATRMASGLAWASCLLVLLALGCYHADRLWALSTVAREQWRLLIVSSALVALLIALLRPLLRRLPDNVLAADVERRYPSLRERLLTTLDLAPALASHSSGTVLPFSSSLTSALAAETEQATQGLDFRRAVSLRPLGVSSLALLLTLCLLVLDALLAPQAFAVWLRRMADPRADIAPYAKTRLQIMPDKDLLPRGESASLVVKTWGDKADKVSLRAHLEGDPPNAWTTVTLTNAVALTFTAVDEPDARIFRYRFPHLTQSVSLIASANDGHSNERIIRVEDRPALLGLRYTLRFPAYMHRAPETLPDSTGGLVAPVGTEIEVNAQANKPLHQADFQQDKQPAQAWPIRDSAVKGHFTVWKNGFFHLNLTDRNGFANAESPRYPISATPDEAPTVQITHPATDMDLVPAGSVPLVAHASDDHGVNALRLLYDSEHPDPRGSGKTIAGHHNSFPLPGATGQPQADVRVRWNLSSVKPKPGDVLRYEVDAWDNDTLRGPHIGRSSSYRVHVVSLPEMQRRLKDELDAEARTLASLRQRQSEAQQQLQQARQHPDSARLTRAQESERNLAQEAHSLAERMTSLSGSLENNNLATKSELQRRDQAQQAVANAAQQKMSPAADSLQKAQTARSSERTAQTAQASHDEAAAKQQLDKAQQLLTRADDPKRLAAEATRLAQEQQRLADSARSLAEDIHAQQQQNPHAGLSPEQREGMEMERRQQAQAQAETQQLQQQLSQAAQSARERGENAQADALQKAADALKQGNATGQQQEAQQNLRRNSPQSAAPHQDKATAALQKAAQAAQQAADQSADPTAQTAADQLEQAARQLRQLAQKQQTLANQTTTHPNSKEAAQLAQQQRQLEQQAAQTGQSLTGSHAAQQSMQQAQQNMSQSGQQLGQDNPEGAQKPAMEAARQLQNAAQQAQRAAQQLRQQQMAQEMQEKIERMAQVQRALQSATARLDKIRTSTGGMNAIQRSEQAQIAGRQQNNEHQAQELADKFPSPAFKQALKMAAHQMHPATENLNKTIPDLGQETQGAQDHAAQTLETIAQALKQQAQGGQQQQDGSQQQQSQSAQQAQQEEALGELMLAQGLQKQVRSGTGKLDKSRQQQLTRAQQREATQLHDGQQSAQQITERARQSLQEMPQAQETLREATQHMDQAAQQLGQQQTGQPTQGHQDQAIQGLDQATKQVQQAMQQQQQQQQQQQAGQQGMPQPNPKGSQPNKAFTRLENVKNGRISTPESRNGRGFAGLPPRQQRVMREGQQERAPAEYQDLVNRYYKSLAEKKR